MKQSLELRQDQINGFSYSFAKALLSKLKELLKSDGIFVDGNDNCSEDNNRYHAKNKIAEVVIAYLVEQLNIEFSSCSNVIQVKELISLTEEFLACFQKKS